MMIHVRSHLIGYGVLYVSEVSSRHTHDCINEISICFTLNVNSPGNARTSNIEHSFKGQYMVHNVK